MPIIFAMLGTLLLISSCSQSSKRKNSYTQPQQILSEEEIGQRRLLEKYRRLREEDWANYLKKSKQTSKRNLTKTSEPQKKPALAPQKKQRPLDEIKMEADQLLSYHCLKYRLETENCQLLTETANFSCQEGDPQNMISCLKSFLSTQKN